MEDEVYSSFTQTAIERFEQMIQLGDASNSVLCQKNTEVICILISSQVYIPPIRLLFVYYFTVVYAHNVLPAVTTKCVCNLILLPCAAQWEAKEFKNEWKRQEAFGEE